MDVFEKVQQLRPEIEGAEENVAAARAILLTEIHGERRPARSRAARRPWFVAAGALGAAAAVTAGVLAVNGITAPTPTNEAVPMPTRSAQPAPSPSPTPGSAALTGPEVLMGAANAAAGFTPPALAPGQFLKSSWVEEDLVLYEPGPDGVELPPGAYGRRATATSAWLVRRSGANYAPSDLRSQWYGEWGGPEVLGTFGDETETRTKLDLVLASYAAEQALKPTEVPRLPENAMGDILWYFDEMPRDPGEIITWLRDHAGTDREAWSDWMSGGILIGLLSHNVGDPEMRASMYRALSMLPGSTVGADQDGKRTVTFDAEIASPYAGGVLHIRNTMTIEMSTGLVTEITETSDAGVGIVPARIPDHRKTFELSVVESLP